LMMHSCETPDFLIIKTEVCTHCISAHRHLYPGWPDIPKHPFGDIIKFNEHVMQVRKKQF
jgi:hypothetical protein